jgi:hypothetical protein
MKDCWRLSFDKADVEDVRKTLDLPHFDYDKFEAISGITKDMFDEKLGKIEEEIQEMTVADIEKLVGKKVKIVK